MCSNCGISCRNMRSITSKVPKQSACSTISEHTIRLRRFIAYEFSPPHVSLLHHVRGTPSLLLVRSIFYEDMTSNTVSWLTYRRTLEGPISRFQKFISNDPAQHSLPLPPSRRRRRLLRKGTVDFPVRFSWNWIHSGKRCCSATSGNYTLFQHQ